MRCSKESKVRVAKRVFGARPKGAVRNKLKLALKDCRAVLDLGMTTTARPSLASRPGLKPSDQCQMWGFEGILGDSAP
jgi:hypothetical protein